MLNYIRFSTRKGENKTLIEIRTAKDCRLDAVIESVCSGVSTKSIPEAVFTAPPKLL